MTQIRDIPIGMPNIKKFAIYRNPVNHPTVMFRKQDVLDTGNYLPQLWFEDYYLWARMLQRGYIFYQLGIYSGFSQCKQWLL